MSVHFWGEDPEGIWVLTILDVPSQRNQQIGFLEEFTLHLHGTSTHPQPGWTMPPLLPKTRQIQGVQREDFHSAIDSSPLNHNCASFQNHNCHEFCTGGCCGPHPLQCRFCKHAMSKDGSTCLQQCPYRQFLNSKRQCQDCQHPCDHCANQPDVCTRCVAGYTSDGRGGCDKECELGEYTHPETHECRKCHPSCSRCSGPYANECRACTSEFTFLEAGVCRTRCQDGFYPDLSTHVCNKCHDDCKTCTGGSARDCTSCHYNSLVQNGQCLQTECEDMMKVNLCYNVLEFCEVAVVADYCCSTCRTNRLANRNRRALENSP
ncbi:Oidioi.mRNA.OKI2018_I69.XSR.g15627.t2.cds [Oikopleura dioica]|nr:Oidioi.mRNA.OKI2018_I69.XSR.g15627.t2.cds [Oikopleura dioica]